MTRHPLSSEREGGVREGRDRHLATHLSVVSPPTGRRDDGRAASCALGKNEYSPVAIEISVPGGRDILLANGSERDSLRSGEFALTGKFGLIREREDKITELRLVAGTRLSAGKLEVTSPPPEVAKIVAVDRDKKVIVVDGRLPEISLSRAVGYP